MSKEINSKIIVVVKMFVCKGIGAKIAGILVATGIITSCTDIPITREGPDVPHDQRNDLMRGNLFGELKLFDSKQELGVNTFLWSAALDKLHDYPLVTSDFEAGILETDWRILPSTPNEKIRIRVCFFGNSLSSDSLKVSILRQEFRHSRWLQMPGSYVAEVALTKAILLAARKLHSTQQQQKQKK